MPHSVHHQEVLRVPTKGPGLVEITEAVRRVVMYSHVQMGTVTVFVRHTSASLTIQENADPDVRTDLQAFLARLVPEGDPLYIHTAEGPDDMPAHVKAALTTTSLTIPIGKGKALLGTWQGVYLWEHRRHGSSREVVIHVTGLPG